MRPLPLILLCGSLAFPALAQDTTNAPATEIENFELKTGDVIIKGFNEIGSMNTTGGTVAVRAKQSVDATTHTKLYGASVSLTSSSLHGFLVIDYDELDHLLRGLDYLNKITYEVSDMPSFDASVTTKSGLRLAAHSERRQGSIQFFLQFEDAPRIPISSEQLTQFQNLIVQAKAALDALRNKNSTAQE